jgi:hypothetical protein
MLDPANASRAKTPSRMDKVHKPLQYMARSLKRITSKQTRRTHNRCMIQETVPGTEGSSFLVPPTGTYVYLPDVNYLGVCLRSTASETTQVTPCNTKAVNTIGNMRPRHQLLTAPGKPLFGTERLKFRHKVVSSSGPKLENIPSLYFAEPKAINAACTIAAPLLPHTHP